MIKTWVALLVIKNRKVLVVHQRDRDYYALPGGTQLDNESHDETLARKLNEELGILHYRATRWNEYEQFGKAENTLYRFVVYAGELVDEIKPGEGIAEIEYINTKTSDIKLGSITSKALLPELAIRGLID